MLEAIVFDVDGTLVTYRFDAPRARVAMVEELSSLGFDVAGLGSSTPTQQIIDAALRQTDSGGPEMGRDEVRRRMYAVLDRFDEESAASASLLPGVRDTLEELRSKGLRMAVMTNSGRRSASKVLSRWDLAAFFEFVLTRDDVDAMKPRPEGLTKAVAKLALPPESVCYVGDTIYDIVAAGRAGIKVVSVATGNYTPERLRSEGADSVIASLAELPRALGLEFAR